MEIKKKIIRWAVGIISVMVLAGVAFVGGFAYQSSRQTEPEPPPPEPEPVITADTIMNEISGLSEHATLEYRYTNVGKFEDKKDFYGWQVPFTTKSFILTYDGAMKLGIDGSEIQVEVVDKEVQVQLPPAQVLSHEIFEDTLEVLDQTKNIFNQIEIDDYATFATDRKAEMEEKAQREGMFTDARDRAQQQLEQFLRSIPLLREGYTIRFVEPVEESSENETAM